MTEWLFRRVAFSLIASCAILGALMWAQTQQPVAGERPTAVGSPAWHMERCEPVTEGAYPGRVIFFPAGEGFVKSSSKAQDIHEALETALNGVNYGHEIVGFCR